LTPVFFLPLALALLPPDTAQEKPFEERSSVERVVVYGCVPNVKRRVSRP
jgi:hypothetical protein